MKNDFIVVIIIFNKGNDLDLGRENMGFFKEMSFELGYFGVICGFIKVYVSFEKGVISFV